MNRDDHAREVRLGLRDPKGLCEKLGWLGGHKRQARGVIIRCPSHGEKNPSCSVTLASDGTIRAKCFACDFAGDALTMIAFAHGLNLRENFTEVLALGAEFGGNLGLADIIRGSERSIARPRLAPVAVLDENRPEPQYPETDVLSGLWRACQDPSTDAETVKMLHGRGIDFCAVSDLRLARVIPKSASLPRWAGYRGDADRRRTWIETGHRLLLPAFDCHGQMRSVRAWRVVDGDTPKRLPPGGVKGSELVQANWQAVKMLRGHFHPFRLFVVEGEPDFLNDATTFAKDDAVIGIGAGSWTESFAKRIPVRTRVYVATHPDKAGDRYAEQVISTLSPRHNTWRIREVA